MHFFDTSCNFSDKICSRCILLLVIVYCSPLPVKFHTLTVYVKCHMYADNGQREDSLVIKQRAIDLS